MQLETLPLSRPTDSNVTFQSTTGRHPRRGSRPEVGWGTRGAPSEARAAQRHQGRKSEWPKVKQALSPSHARPKKQQHWTFTCLTSRPAASPVIIKVARPQQQSKGTEGIRFHARVEEIPLRVSRHEGVCLCENACKGESACVRFVFVAAAVVVTLSAVHV